MTDHGDDVGAKKRVMGKSGPMDHSASSRFKDPR
jgi:hypothetical protein